MKKLFIAAIPFSFLLLLLFGKDLAMVGDLGRHLKLGQIVLQCHCVPQTNLFSYTNPDFPIVNHEWLGEVIFYLVSVFLGTNGLLIFKMFLVLTSASILYVTALKKGSLFWVTIFSILGAILFSMRFFVLPELYSYLFISLFIFLIERYKQTKKIYYLLPLIPLEVLWVNMHIYFILGVVMYGLFFLEEVFLTSRAMLLNVSREGSRAKESRIMNQELREKTKERKSIYSLLLNSYFLLLASCRRFLDSLSVARNDKRKILIIGIILILATLVNPSFIKGALLPFTFSSNYGFPVEENMSPFTIFTPSTTNTNVAYTLYLEVFLFEVLAVIFLACFVVRKQWKEIFHMGNGLTALMLGFKFTRCIGLFPLLGFVPLVQSLTVVEERLKKDMDVPMRNTIKGVIALAVFLIAAFQVNGLVTYNILGFGFVPSAENAVAFIKQAQVKGRIFNNYIIGNYLIYGLYSQQQVYIDARPEAYPAPFFVEYWRMMADENFFDSQVKKYNINAVVFNVVMDDPAKIRPFLLRLLHSPDWAPVYADGTVTVLAKNNKVNQGVIEKYRISIH